MTAATATQPPVESSSSSSGLVGPEDLQEPELERRLQALRTAGLHGPGGFSNDDIDQASGLSTKYHIMTIYRVATKTFTQILKDVRKYYCDFHLL